MSRETESTSDDNEGPVSIFDEVGDEVRESVAARLSRHDSTFSVGSDYDYGSANDLNMWQGAALLTAGKPTRFCKQTRECNSKLTFLP